jgi:hypothetical protein
MGMNLPLTPQERIRRVALLCTHCFRNFAFYRAGWKGVNQQANTQFLKTANSGFIDIGYLEWSKLFADYKGNHHWTKVIENHQLFQTELLNFLRITPEEFRFYIQAVRTYRDKFIAHLDDERVMHPPKTKVARNSAAFLYDYLRTHPEAGKSLQDAKLTAREYYEHLYRHAFFAYKSAL